MLVIGNFHKILVFILAGLLPILVFSQVGNNWTSISNERLHSPEPGDWMNYRRSYDVTGFSPLDDINRRNVDDLRMVWSYSMRDGSRWLATPIVANGLMYIGEGTGRIIALDAITGELEWSHTRTFPADIALSEANRR
jgi:alcohol dehydrogenase (cytochrome c)